MHASSHYILCQELRADLVVSPRRSTREARGERLSVLFGRKQSINGCAKLRPPPTFTPLGLSPRNKRFDAQVYQVMSQAA